MISKKKKIHPRRHEDDDEKDSFDSNEENKIDQNDEIMSDEASNESKIDNTETQPSEEVTVLIDYDKLNSQPPSSVEIFEGKLSIFSSFQFKGFDSDTFKPEGKIKIRNEKDEEEFKTIPVLNYIRWKNENLMQKSNSKIVEWSDGSYSLFIGEKHFDILLTNMDNIRYGINAGDVSLISNPVKKRMVVTSDDGISQQQEQKGSMVQIKGRYYNAQICKKEEMSSKYSRRKKEHQSKNLENLTRKRKRS